MQSYWHKQATDKPLFPDLIWSRPESLQGRGKLLIMGGNSFGFAAVGQAYVESVKAGAGTVRVLLPEAVRKAAGPILEHGEFAASTPSGSFGQKAVAECLAQAAWADSVLLPGDLGRNSETAVLIEKFLEKYTGQLTLTKDAADYALPLAAKITGRPNTLLVLSFAQLQKLGTALKSPTVFTYNMDLLRLVDALHEFTTRYSVFIVTKQLDTLYVAANGQVSTTPNTEKIWRVKTAAHATTWWLQNPTKPFEAMSTAVISSQFEWL